MNLSPISYFRIPEIPPGVYDLPSPRLTGAQKMQMLDSSTEQNAYNLAFNVEGVRPEDIAVVISDGHLVIEFEKEYDPNKVAHTNWDKSFGIFTRWFSIPKGIGPEHLKTKVIGGRLEIRLDKVKIQQPDIDSDGKRRGPEVTT